MLPPLAAALYVGGPVLSLLVGVVAGCLAWEWSRMVGAGRPLAAASASSGFLAVAGWLAVGPDHVILLLATLAAVTAACAVIVKERRGPLVVAGLVVSVLSCLALLWLHAREPDGAAVVAGLIGCVIATDVAAYAAGQLIGGPRLAPRISPGKTWAGLAGGIVAGALAGAVFDFWMSDGRNLPVLCLLGAGVALVAQAGDLCESALKRRLEVKDSGRLIPGHGGVLDRCDGHMAAQCVAAVLVMAGARPPVLW